MELRSGLAPRLATAVREAARELETAVHEDCDLIEQIERLLVEVCLPVRRELTDREQERYADLCRRERKAHLRHLEARRRFDTYWKVIDAELLESG